MDYQTLIDSMTPEVYENFKRALEIGRWPDGRTLSAEQKEHVMAAVIAWGERHLPTEQRVGFIDRGSKAEGALCDDDEPAPVKFLQ